jgi:hypothetical protein
MQWEVVGVIAEVISALAVVITLLFLAIEIRINRKATQSAAVASLADGFNAVNFHLMDDPEFTKLWLFGLADPSQLDEVGLARVTIVLRSYINHFATLKKYYESGALPKDEWDVYSAATAGLVNSPGGQEIARKMAIPESVLAEIEKYRNTKQEYGWLKQS